jgi:hypothetical protein
VQPRLCALRVFTLVRASTCVRSYTCAMRALSSLVVLSSILACSESSPSAPANAFQLSVVVDGIGTVTTEPNVLTCAGPKDCGSVTVAGSTVTVKAQALRSDYSFSTWERDGAPVSGNPITVDAANGARVSLRARFVNTGSPGVDGGGGGGGDAGNAADAGDASATRTCGTTACASGKACCYSTLGIVAAFVCSAGTSCDANAQEVAAACSKPSDCMAAGEVCCPQDGRGGYTEFVCRPTAQCFRPMCDVAHPCPSSLSCDIDGPFSRCAGPRR